MQALRLLVLLGVSGAGAWTTVSQTFYGSQYEDIQLMLNYSSDVGPVFPDGKTPLYYRASQVSGTSGITLDGLALISHIWHHPKVVDDPVRGKVPVVDGLGGGIAWAWDPALCGDFLPLFKEDIGFVNLIDCSELQQAFARALSSWSNNHRYINFLDVTEECASIAQDAPYNRSKAEAWEDCPYLEMWVTGVGTAAAVNELSSSSGDIADGIPIALAEMSARRVGQSDASFGSRPGASSSSSDRGPAYHDSTTCTSGQTGPCFAFTNGIEIQAQDMVELYHVKISFGTDSTNCWYLDSAFCSGFHTMKNGWTPSTVKFTVLLCCLIIMIIASFLFLGKLRVFGSCHRRAKRLKKGKSSCSVRKRCSKLYEEASQWSVIGTTLQLIFIVIPPIMYTQIFVVCFDCYDFEGAAVHEIGHALGLGHPNTARDEVARVQLGTGDRYPSGDNVYQALFENHGRIDSNTCLNPWTYVKNNTPPGAVLDELGCKQGSANDNIASCVGIRDTVMEAFSQNNPSVCITEDDLEAIQTIYPDCDSCITTPVCYRTRLNLGLVRIAAYVLMPLIFIMSGLLIFQNFIASSRQEELDELNDEVDDVQKALAKKNKQVVVGRWLTGAKAAQVPPGTLPKKSLASKPSIGAAAREASSSAGPSTDYEAPYPSESDVTSSSKRGPRFDRM